MKLKDAVVIVTGAGSGIGKETALLFAKEGAKVVVCGRRIELLLETVKMIEYDNGIAYAISIDVSDWQQVVKMVGNVYNQYEKIDILINNAGIPFGKPIIDTTTEEWDNVLNINLKGVFLCCKAVLPVMKDGIIITISSMMGISGGKNAGAYSSSKFGIIGLMQSLIEEHKNIRAYTICPGSVITDISSSNVGMLPKRVAEYIVKLCKSNKDVTGSPILFDDNIKNIIWFSIPLGLKYKIRKLYRSIKGKK